MEVKRIVSKVLVFLMGIVCLSSIFLEKAYAKEDVAVYSSGDISMIRGEKALLEPEFGWFFSFYKNYNYASSNEDVATVDDDGYVQAVGDGDTKIVASLGGTGIKRTFNVTVKTITVVLDAGHGGKDRGTADLKKTKKEKDFNLDVAKACKNELEKYQGVKVYMTRNDDTYVSLEDRCLYAKKVNADIFISLHQNAASKHDKHGSKVYVSHSKYKKSFNEESTKLGEKILGELNKLGFENAGVKTRIAKNLKFTFEDDKADYYHVIRSSVEKGFPGIIIEHGYMDWPSDYEKMDSKTERQNMGKADAAAIASYYRLVK